MRPELADTVANPAYVLRTRRLGLRHLVPADAARLRPVFGDPSARQFYPAMGEPEALDRWVAWNLRNYAEFGFGLFAVELLEAGLFVGDAGITFQTVEGRRIHEVGWHIHPEHRNRGYASEAGAATLAYAFTSLGAPIVGSIVDPANGASRRVAARVHGACRWFEGRSGRMLLYYTPRAEEPDEAS
jgi:RimJ/RimL family protein N-acetyltransferase